MSEIKGNKGNRKNPLIEIPLKDVMEGVDTFFSMMCMTVELINLIKEESRLKKHHRAYMHVREEIERYAGETMDFISRTVEKLDVKMPLSYSMECPFSETDGEDAVTISKEKFGLMTEDLLTMAELIQMVCDMRTKDIKTIRSLGRFMPDFADYEEKRLSLYGDALREAESIIERWDADLNE